MDKTRLEGLLNAIARGETSVADALTRLRDFPYDDLGFARVDTHRSLRTGFPEVVFCERKTPEQTAAVCARLAGGGGPVLATRADAAAYAAIKKECPDARYHETARVVVIGEPSDIRGNIAIVSAGTADQPVAEEAAVTAEAIGCRVVRYYDVGVAGIHRLFDVLTPIREADAVVAVAGMEGALPGVVAGLTGGPVIAVPTSVGYGVHLNGLAPLLTMLNTCAAGVAVVNVDNGFGAGYLAAVIARRRQGKDV